MERVNGCAYRSTLLVRNELPPCSYCAASKQFKCNLRPRLCEMPASRTSSLAVGGNKVTGAADAENHLVFPVQASPPPSQCYGGIAKELLPFPACEMLRKILIFKVCRLLVMMKTLTYSSQDQGKSTFLDRTSAENIGEAGRTVACCWFVRQLPASMPACFTDLLFCSELLWHLYIWGYMKWFLLFLARSQLSAPACAAPGTEEAVCPVSSVRHSQIP